MALATEWARATNERKQHLQARAHQIQARLGIYRDQLQKQAASRREQAIALRNALGAERITLSQEMETHLNGLQQQRAIASQQLRHNLAEEHQKLQQTMTDKRQQYQQELTSMTETLKNQLHQAQVNRIQANQVRRQTTQAAQATRAAHLRHTLRSYRRNLTLTVWGQTAVAVSPDTFANLTEAVSFTETPDFLKDFTPFEVPTSDLVVTIKSVEPMETMSLLDNIQGQIATAIAQQGLDPLNEA